MSATILLVSVLLVVVAAVMVYGKPVVRDGNSVGEPMLKSDSDLKRRFTDFMKNQTQEVQLNTACFGNVHHNSAAAGLSLWLCKSSMPAVQEFLRHEIETATIRAPTNGNAKYELTMQNISSTDSDLYLPGSIFQADCGKQCTCTNGLNLCSPVNFSVFVLKQSVCDETACSFVPTTANIVTACYCPVSSAMTTLNPGPPSIRN